MNKQVVLDELDKLILQTEELLETKHFVRGKWLGSTLSEDFYADDIEVVEHAKRIRWNANIRFFVENILKTSNIYSSDLEYYSSHNKFDSIQHCEVLLNELKEKIMSGFIDLEQSKEENVIMPELNNTVLSNKKVFIVHGHDSEAKLETARIIEKLGLEAIILHEQASSGDTIIEKIERNSDVGFAVVLYTPCDEGCSKQENTMRNRARQNVVFEHGYLIGKLGRNRVCALVKNDIETPGDISSVVYVQMDSGGAWKYTLVDEMNAVNFELSKDSL